MQVDYKTENGTIIFVLPDTKAFDVRIRFKRFITWRTDVSSHIEMFDEGITVVSFTRNVKTEDLTKIFTPKIGVLYEMFGYGYLTSDIRNTFKSLMQFLKIYEENPIGISNPYDLQQKRYYLKAKERTGEWILLFKEM